MGTRTGAGIGAGREGSAATGGKRCGTLLTGITFGIHLTPSHAHPGQAWGTKLGSMVVIT